MAAKTTTPRHVSMTPSRCRVTVHEPEDRPRGRSERRARPGVPSVLHRPLRYGARVARDILPCRSQTHKEDCGADRIGPAGRARFLGNQTIGLAQSAKTEGGEARRGPSRANSFVRVPGQPVVRPGSARWFHPGSDAGRRAGPSRVPETPANASDWVAGRAALYRTGDGEAATDALREAMRLRGDDHARDWLYLATAQHDLGQKVAVAGPRRRAVKAFPANAQGSRPRRHPVRGGRVAPSVRRGPRWRRRESNPVPQPLVPQALRPISPPQAAQKAAQLATLTTSGTPT